MKCRFIILAALVLLTVCGCGRGNYLSKSVWCATRQVEKDEQTGVAVTSLYFLSEDSVNIYRSVVCNGELVVKPYKKAHGSYTLKRIKGRDYKISVSAVDFVGDSVELNGRSLRPKKMILVDDDRNALYYRPLKGIKLPD